MAHIRRKTQHVVHLDPAVDHGPAIMIRRGEIVREDRADPDNANRTVAGTSRRDGLRTMWAKGLIDGAEWHAATRFRDDLELASGARPNQGDNGGVRSTARHYEPGIAQIDAQTRVTGAWQAVGLVLTGVVSWVIVSRGTLSDYAECKGVRKERACQMLSTGLARLVVFYAEK